MKLKNFILMALAVLLLPVCNGWQFYDTTISENGTVIVSDENGSVVLSIDTNDSSWDNIKNVPIVPPAPDIDHIAAIKWYMEQFGPNS
jgi:hypothetical protein